MELAAANRQLFALIVVIQNGRIRTLTIGAAAARVTARADCRFLGDSADRTVDWGSFLTCLIQTLFSIPKPTATQAAVMLHGTFLLPSLAAPGVHQQQRASTRRIRQSPTHTICSSSSTWTGEHPSPERSRAAPPDGVIRVRLTNRLQNRPGVHSARRDFSGCRDSASRRAEDRRRKGIWNERT